MFLQQPTNLQWATTTVDHQSTANKLPTPTTTTTTQKPMMSSMDDEPMKETEVQYEDDDYDEDDESSYEYQQETLAGRLDEQKTAFQQKLHTVWTVVNMERARLVFDVCACKQQTRRTDQQDQERERESSERTETSTKAVLEDGRQTDKIMRATETKLLTILITEENLNTLNNDNTIN